MIYIVYVFKKINYIVCFKTLILITRFTRREEKKMQSFSPPSYEVNWVHSQKQYDTNFVFS